MTEWTIKHQTHWYIYADGKEMAMCDTEDSAIILLNSIQVIEQSNKRLKWRK